MTHSTAPSWCRTDLRRRRPMRGEFPASTSAGAPSHPQPPVRGGSIARRLVAVGVVAFCVALMWPSIVSAGDTDHTIIVDGTPYSSSQESGSSWHFSTPGPTATSASVPERSQTWTYPTGNGSIKLPCPYGIHWISNANVLTVSHCLDNPNPTTTTSEVTTSTSTTTTTTTAASTTTTSTTTLPTTSTTTTTLPPSTSTSTTSPAATTTVPPTSTTQSPTTTTTTGPSTSTTNPTTTTTLPSTTSSVATTSTTSSTPSTSTLPTPTTTSATSTTQPVVSSTTPSTLPLIPPATGCQDNPSTPIDDCTGQPPTLPATGVDVAVPFFAGLACLCVGLVLCRRRYERTGR